MGKKILPINQTALTGKLEVPGDKSISHRAVIFGALANGKTTVENFLDGEDCLRTVTLFRELGVDIERDGTSLVINGHGVAGLKEPTKPLYFGNSGTTARLMIGILAGLPFFSTVYGDSSLTKRPMDRVLTPVQHMGATYDGRERSYLPLVIRGGHLKGIDYTLPVKSAQVKSCVLLAGLLAKGKTTVREDTPSRNHTEMMLQAFGADVFEERGIVTVTGQQTLQAQSVYVPGDISSAAFYFAAAAIVPYSLLTIKNVGLNPTRTGIIDVLKQMGASLTISREQTISGERLGDVTISYSHLTGVTVEGDDIPRLIDEIPIIALLATQAEGKTVIRDAKELKYKETDRLHAIVTVLTALGARVEPTEDGMIIQGKTTLTGGNVPSFNDHRIAMMAAVASLITSQPTQLDDDACIAISYPNFFADLTKALESKQGNVSYEK